MKVVGYLRVSTTVQVEGNGLAVQQTAIKAWAKAQDAEIIAWCRDEGISGAKPAAERPGLLNALDAIKTGNADGIVVAHLDRVARTLTIQEAVLAQVWRYGGSIYSVDTGEIQKDDSDDPMRTFVRQVMGAAAQLERGMITARLKGGRQHKASQGGYAYGSPPYGWKSVDKELVRHEEEQKGLALMVEMRAGGASYRTIVAALTDGGYPPKRSKKWEPIVVSRILSRDG